MESTKLFVDLILKGGERVRFFADSINVTPDHEAYVFNSYAGTNAFTVFEPVRKSDIAFLSAEKRIMAVNTPEQEETNG